MKTKKNPLLITAAICLMVLATLNLGYSLARTLGFVRVLPSGMRDMQELRGGNLPQAGGEDQVQEGMPGNRGGRSNPPEGFDPENMPEGFDPENVGRGNRTVQGNPANNTFLSGTFSGWLGVGIYGVGLVLAVVAGLGMIKKKKWAVVLGTILTIILIALNVVSLFNFLNWLQFAISLAAVLLGIAVIVLLLLPSARKAYIKKQDIFDEEDYALYYGDEEEENPVSVEDDEADPAL